MPWLRRWQRRAYCGQCLLLEADPEVVAVAVAHEASVRVEGAYRPHHERLWFLAKSCDTGLSQTDKLLEVVDPHASSSVACIGGHADIIDEQEVVS